MNTSKEEALRRLKITQGHLNKVQGMLENNEYCLDIIHQSQAVQAALKKMDEVILHGHLHTCVLKDAHGSGSEKMVEEVIELFRKQA